MKRKIRLICIYLFLPLLIIYACTSKSTEGNSKNVAENNEKFGKENEKDAQFIVDNVSAISGQIRLSELAEERTSDAEVREVAKGVRIHYGKLLGQLEEYASSKAISFPTEGSAHEKDKIEKLMKNKTFDKEWSSELRDLNKKTIDNFEKGSTCLSDENLKIWVSASLPGIRKSHDKIMACNNRLE